jgi:hypothetical protein
MKSYKKNEYTNCPRHDYIEYKYYVTDEDFFYGNHCCEKCSINEDYDIDINKIPKEKGLCYLKEVKELIELGINYLDDYCKNLYNKLIKSINDDKILFKKAKEIYEQFLIRNRRALFYYQMVVNTATPSCTNYNLIDNLLSLLETKFNKININKNENNGLLNKDEINKVLEFFEENYIIGINEKKMEEIEEFQIKEINKIEKNLNKNHINLSNEDDEDNLNDKNNFLQLNATLLGIQNDLIQKIENKQEEIEKTKKDLKNSIQLNKEFMNMAKNQTGQDVNIFSEKYNYLLDLYNSEQDKVKFLQNEYMNLLNGLSNYVNNGEEIIIKLGKMWDLNPILKTNFEMAEPEFPEIEPINESDLFTENS